MSVEELRAAVAVALAAFLLILRLDAERLGAAEYDEPDDWGRRPPFLPRLGWYFTGIALVALVEFVHPPPRGGLPGGPPRPPPRHGRAGQRGHRWPGPPVRPRHPRGSHGA